MLRNAGFRYIREGKGDHEIWGNDDGVHLTVDGADGREIPLGTLRAMLKVAGLKLAQGGKGKRR